MHRSAGSRLLEFQKRHRIAAPSAAPAPSPPPRSLPAPPQPSPVLWVRALVVLLALNIAALTAIGVQLIRVEADLFAASVVAAEVQP